MNAFLAGLVHDPLRYIEYIFALCGALGAVLFIAGFASGARHIFTYGESWDHMQHVRMRIVWGVLVCMVTLGLWEIVRVIIGQAPLSYLILSFVLLTPLWIPWLKKLTSSGGGH